jgi:hypothetical protein
MPPVSLPAKLLKKRILFCAVQSSTVSDITRRPATRVKRVCG